MARRSAVADCWRWTLPRVAALVQQQNRQAEKRAFFGADYKDNDQAFTWENGRRVHPDVIRQRVNRAVGKARTRRGPRHEVVR